MKYQISVPEPCHEDWSAMTPNEKGRFCAACSKTVVDFRRMGTKEIVAHLEKSSGGACGRFSTYQLGEQTVETNSRWTHWLAAIGLIISLAPTPLAAQSNVEKTEQVEHSNLIMLGKPQIRTTGATREIFIRGRVMNESGEQPLSGAFIRVEGANIGGIAGEDGYFSFELPSSFTDSSINITVSYLGCESIEFCMRLNDEQAEYEVGPVLLKESFLGEVVYTRRTPIRAMRQRVRHLLSSFRHR